MIDPLRGLAATSAAPSLSTRDWEWRSRTLGDMTETIEACQHEAVDLAPKVPEAHFHLAETLRGG